MSSQAQYHYAFCTFAKVPVSPVSASIEKRCRPNPCFRLFKKYLAWVILSTGVTDWVTDHLTYMNSMSVGWWEYDTVQQMPQTSQVTLQSCSLYTLTEFQSCVIQRVHDSCVSL